MRSNELMAAYDFLHDDSALLRVEDLKMYFQVTRGIFSKPSHTVKAVDDPAGRACRFGGIGRKHMGTAAKTRTCWGDWTE